MENFRRCRICISESAVMMSIFGEDALWRKLTYFANVQIEEGDNLPQQICVMCAKNVINAFSFKQKCEQADSFFRKQLRNSMDGEVISVSSGDEKDNNEKEEMKCDKYRFGFWNISACRPSSPISMKETNQKTEEPTPKASEIKDQMEPRNEERVPNKDEIPNEKKIPNEDEAPNDDEIPNENKNPNEDEIPNEDDVHDDNEELPLIPEIELITPNDDDKRTAYGYQCSICFEFFAMKSILKHHVKIKHPEANPTYECFECKKIYLSKRFLDKHIRRGRCIKKRKNQSRVMQCAECQETFPSGHHLGWHKRAGNCPQNKQGTLNNFSPVPIGNEETESEEEQKNASSTTEKEPSPTIKHTRRRKWGRTKRKARCRIRLNSDKIELARQLVQQDASTTKIAQELQISRTYAWKLRKSLDLFSTRSVSETNCPNGKQENNVQNAGYQSQQQVLNLSIPKQQSIEPLNLQNKEKTMAEGKTQANGQPNQHHNGESEEEEESKRDDDEDGEETESAEESHQDDIRKFPPFSPQPGCSQNSLPSCSEKNFPSSSQNSLHVNSQNALPLKSPKSLLDNGQNSISENIENTLPGNNQNSLIGSTQDPVASSTPINTKGNNDVNTNNIHEEKDVKA